MSSPEPAFITELMRAFAAEAMASVRYGYYAQIAEIEGRTEAAQLFVQLAESVSCAAQGHMDVLRDASGDDTEHPIADTSTNLASAVATELDEADSLYPRLTAAALTAGLPDVASWLTTVTALKQSHLSQLDQALTELTAQATSGQDGTDGR